MGQQLLKRDDFHGRFDSVEWAFETHVGTPDREEANSAILHGNEDAPTLIEFFAEEEPDVNSVPLFTWNAGDVGVRQ